MKNILLISLLFFLLSCSNHTVNFKSKNTFFQEGYVIEHDNDTIYGRISNIHKHSHLYIDFKYNSGKDTVLDPVTIKGYQIGHHVFRLVSIPSKHNKAKIVLAEVLVSGTLSLLKTKIKTDFFLPPITSYLCKLPSDSITPAGSIYHFAKLVNDYSALSDSIHSHYFKNNEKNIIKVCESYNSWKLLH